MITDSTVARDPMTRQREAADPGADFQLTRRGIVAWVVGGATVTAALDFLVQTWITSDAGLAAERTARAVPFVALWTVVVLTILRRILRARQRTNEELERANRALAAIARLSESAGVPRPIDEVLSELLGHGLEALGGAVGALYTIEDAADRLTLTVSRGAAGNDFPASLPLSEGILAKAIALRKPIVVADTGEWTGPAVDLPDPYRAWLIAPVMRGRYLHGAVAVGAMAPDSFTEQSIRVLQAVADRAAIAFETAQLEHGERRWRLGAEHARRHLALLAQGTKALVVHVADRETALKALANVIVPEFADWCAIDLLDGVRLHRVAAIHGDPEAGARAEGLLAAYPRWDIPVRRVIENGSELLWDASAPPGKEEDTDHAAMTHALGLQSSMIVPIRIDGGAIGAITCATAPGRRGFRPSDVAAVEELAARAALALERMSLHSATERSAITAANHAGQLRRLMESALAIVPQLTEEEVARVAVAQACRVLQTRRALVIVIAGDGTRLRIASDDAGPWPNDAALLKAAQDAAGGVAARIVDAKLGEFALAARLNDRTGAAIGALVVAGEQGAALDDDDESIVVSLAQMASVALDNARLYESLRAGEERLRTLVEAAPLAIVELDLKAGVRFWNSAADDLFGLVPAARGDGFRRAADIRTAHLLERVVADTVAGRPVAQIEDAAWRADGSTVPLSLEAAPVRDAAGTVGSVLLVARDMTFRLAFEEQLVRAQRLEAVGQMAGGVAHDFNNLLTVIIGHASLLSRTLGIDDAKQADVSAIAAAAERAAGITSQLLTISRGDLASIEVFSPRRRIELLTDTMHSLLAPTVELRTELSAADGLVRMSPSQFDQILLNLAVNARDAMPGGGTFTIQAYDRDEAVVLEVEDTGRGMDEATLERCFEPFFSTKGSERGTGLGLATVYSVVVGAGGDVEVRSAPGEGTTFTVRLRRTAASLPETQPTAERPFAGGSERILLVEDERGLRQLAAEVLRSEGYVVTAASDGQAALDLIGAEPQAPDLVVTDVVMPRIGGVELARRLGTDHPDIPVLFVTGYADQASRADLQGADVLIKPFLIDDLVAKVREVLDRPNGDVLAGHGSKR